MRKEDDVIEMNLQSGDSLTVHEPKVKVELSFLAFQLKFSNYIWSYFFANSGGPHKVH